MIVATALFLSVISSAEANPTPIPVCTASQRVFTGSYLIEDQDSLDRFQACRRIDGDLTISSQNLADLANLNLQKVAGDLTIADSPVLTDLKGLHQLRRVTGTLLIKECAALSSLEGLGSLKRVREMKLRNSGLASLEGLHSGVVMKALSLHDLPELVDLQGVPAHAPRTFEVSSNEALETLWPLSFEEEARKIVLQNNPVLSDLHGFDNLTRIHRLDLEGNGFADVSELGALVTVHDLAIGGAKLHDLSALTDLRTARHLEIRGTSLTSLDGLAGVETRGLYLSSNEALEDMSGLSNTDVALHLVLEDNTALVAIDLPAALTTLGYLVIDGNDALTSLDGLTQITGIQPWHDAVTIANNSSLESIDGLASIQDGISMVNIYGNESLETLDGFPAIHNAQCITIYDNAQLVDVSGLLNLTGTTGCLDVFDNLSLCETEAAALLGSLNYTYPTDSPSLSGNTGTCTSP
jgi:hypothetical protein